MNYDLEERCAQFSEALIVFLKTTPKNEITRPIINQLMRSGTSIGANYMEANQAASKKDFRNKACISRKEASETKYWLRLLATTQPELRARCQSLWKESHELTLIFSKIVYNADR